MDSSCSGSSGSTSLSATNTSFAAGQQILIHQTRGTGAGNYEVNYIASYVAGTITTLLPLSNTYTDSGASQAQVLVLSQYSGATISGTLTAKAWDGNVGGILAFVCNGTVTIPGTASASGKGYQGGVQNSANNSNGNQGEGTSGAGSSAITANGNGGGGGDGGGGTLQVGNSGAGGGHASAASNGPIHFEFSQDGGPASSGGGTAGSADLTTMVFGGGGGGGGRDGEAGSTVGVGGGGGGAVFIFGKEIIVTGNINCNGANGTQNNNNHDGGGGGGAGGSIFLKGINVNYGTNLLTVAGGTGAWGCAQQHQNLASDGKEGRIRIEACTLNGNSSPTASENEGGYNFCGSASAIIG